MPHKIYSLKEVSVLLKYASADVLRNEIADGRVKAEKIGNQWVIGRNELERLYVLRYPKTRATDPLDHLFYCDVRKTGNLQDCSCLKGKIEAEQNKGFSAEAAEEWGKGMKEEGRENH